MPSSKKENTIFRQWAMLHCLSAHYQETQTIHQRLAHEHRIEVHENTVLRDLKSLERAGLPLERTDTKPINWRIKKDWQDKVGGMTNAEALMIVLAAKHLQQALPATLTTALQDLLALAQKSLNDKHQQKDHHHAKWLNKIRIVPSQQPQLIPSIKAEIQAVLTEALLDNQPVSAVYKGCELAKLSPLALIVRGNVLYLAATRDEEAEVKHFALHRFQSVTLLYGETLNKPVNFDIDALLAQGWGDFQDAIAEKIIKLQLWCDKGLKDHLVEMPLTQQQWIDFTKPENGRYLLTVKLPYTWQLYQWLLSQGSRLQVVEPEWLRDKMCQEVMGMLENYS
jgi:predicted DNA-binding transcriptional regulator YafY